MPGDPRQATPTGPEFYEIRVKGHLDSRRSEWFDGLSVTHAQSDETVLSGPVADQAELFGLLLRIRDLGLPLELVVRVKSSGKRVRRRNKMMRRIH